ncbi:MAG: hypothetical protein ABSD67_05620 [Terracidiphilus sp.]|jgi:hypothetical protein
MLPRKFFLCLFAALLAISASTIGCQSQPQTDETVIYKQWEGETHRDHKDLAQRPPEEQKEYHDWRQQHPDRH